MEKLTRQSLHALHEKLAGEIKIRQTGNKKAFITVNMGDCGIAQGAKKVFQILCDEVDKAGLRGSVIVTQTSLEGLCAADTLVEVLVHGQELVRYGHVNETNAAKIVSEHIINGTVITDLLLKF